MIKGDGRTVTVGGSRGVRRRGSPTLDKIDMLDWFHLSLMECPDCGRKNIYCRPLAKEMKHIHVCYDCGYSVVEDIKGLRAGRMSKPELSNVNDLKKLSEKCKGGKPHKFDENGCCTVCTLCKPCESGKVAEVSKAGEAGQSVSQNPLRGRNPSRRNESSDRVSGSRQKSEVTSGKCYEIHESELRSWGSRLQKIVDRLGLLNRELKSKEL
ncbi:unnamed protein product, partial [marine sediment metagenome]